MRRIFSLIRSYRDQAQLEIISDVERDLTKNRPRKVILLIRQNAELRVGRVHEDRITEIFSTLKTPSPRSICDPAEMYRSVASVDASDPLGAGVNIAGQADFLADGFDFKVLVLRQSVYSSPVKNLM